MTQPPVAPALESIHVRGTTPGAGWSPVIGREVQALLTHKRLNDDETRRVQSETCRILSRCIGPDEHGQQRTGLVIGYVQSGKTLSFTALTALARDNRYRLVIVLGGTTVNLLDQSLRRLRGDLDIEGHGQRIWTLLANPTENALGEISRALRGWSEYADRPDRCRTVLIVAMKHHTHLANLEALLRRCDLSDVSALVIDDEGDQASLNIKVGKYEESTTYSRIRALRNALPTHTYLQYTATPQAPLLISRIDMLSPQFAELLQPGPDYVGGKDLFDEPSLHIEIIPSTELPDEDASDELPKSLEYALKLFYVGAAAGYLGDTIGQNRSMMIHPSQRRDWHARFLAWVNSSKTSWFNLLSDALHSPDRRALVDSFRDAYSDLLQTETRLVPFEQIEQELRYAIDQTEVLEINAREGRIPTINWKSHYSLILVGGTGLDRGFTVEGLTVTYMPRSAGIGNADTVQQRGRFFGYKRPYLGLIRIFLESSVDSAFRDYVIHEQSMRRSLEKHRDSGKPLAEWRRDFFLDRSMTPTRRSVLSLDYMRNRSREWSYPVTPHAEEALARNQATVSAFLSKHVTQFAEDPGDVRRTPEQRHSVARLPLRVVYQELLVPLVAVGDDLLNHIHVILQIESAIEEHPKDLPPLLCDVYRMKKGALRYRGLDEEGQIKNLLQGSNARTGYSGDRALRSDERVAIQIHMLELGEKDEDKTKATKIVVKDVPAIAASIPENLRVDTYHEPADG